MTFGVKSPSQMNEGWGGGFSEVTQTRKRFTLKTEHKNSE